MPHFISALQNPCGFTFCIVILDMKSSSIAKVRLSCEEIEFDQYLEHINRDLAQRLVGLECRKRILNPGHILASNPGLADIFSLGGFKNEI